MYSKQDYLDAALADIDNYPKLAMLYRAGDPRITQHLGAIAFMLAMLSQQTEAAVMEVFHKTRPSTVLADAAMLIVLGGEFVGHWSLVMSDAML